MTVDRDGKTFVMDGRWKFKAGDTISVAIHAPEREDALRELAGIGFTLLPDDETDDAPDTDG